MGKRKSSSVGERKPFQQMVLEILDIQVEKQIKLDAYFIL